MTCNFSPIHITSARKSIPRADLDPHLTTRARSHKEEEREERRKRRERKERKGKGKEGEKGGGDF